MRRQRKQRSWWPCPILSVDQGPLLSPSNRRRPASESLRHHKAQLILPHLLVGSLPPRHCPQTPWPSIWFPPLCWAEFSTTPGTAPHCAATRSPHTRSSAPCLFATSRHTSWASIFLLSTFLRQVLSDTLNGWNPSLHSSAVEKLLTLFGKFYPLNVSVEAVNMESCIWRGQKCRCGCAIEYNARVVTCGAVAAGVFQRC